MRCALGGDGRKHCGSPTLEGAGDRGSRQASACCELDSAATAGADDLPGRRHEDGGRELRQPVPARARHNDDFVWRIGGLECLDDRSLAVAFDAEPGSEELRPDV
jgi:hypothetical protein